MLCTLSQSTVHSHSYWQSRGSCITLVNSVSHWAAKQGFQQGQRSFAYSEQLNWVKHFEPHYTLSGSAWSNRGVVVGCWGPAAPAQPCAELKIAPPEVHALCFTLTPALLPRPVEVQIFLAICHEWRNVFSKVTSFLRAALPRQTGPKCDYSNCSQGRELTPQ